MTSIREIIEMGYVPEIEVFRRVEDRMYCWDCQRRPRSMCFPETGGSYLSVKCELCSKAAAVLARIDGRAK